jgi:hypothetical protein
MPVRFPHDITFKSALYMTRGDTMLFSVLLMILFCSPECPGRYDLRHYRIIVFSTFLQLSPG